MNSDYIPPRLDKLKVQFVPIDQFMRERKAEAYAQSLVDRMVQTEQDQFAQPPRFIGAFMLTMQDVCFLMQCGIAVD